MLDAKGTELLVATVADVGSVENAVRQMAAVSMAETLLTIQKGDMLATMFEGQENASEMVADMIQPELEAQALALLFAGAFFQERYPDEMAALFAQVTAEAEAAAAELGMSLSELDERL